MENVEISSETIKKLKWAKVVITVGLTMALGAFSYFKVHRGHIARHEWMIFIAPMFTFAVATMALYDYIVESYVEHHNGERCSDTASNELIIILGSICCLSATMFCCVMLSEYNGWEMHLWFMAILFLIFVGWDLLILANTSIMKHRQQVIAGNRLVNRPTLVAIVVAYVSLKIIEMYPADVQIVRVTAQKEMELMAAGISPQDIFVAGIIAFHLVVASFGYFTTILDEQHMDIRNKNIVVKGIHMLISWIPNGPRRKEGEQLAPN